MSQWTLDAQRPVPAVGLVGVEEHHAVAEGLGPQRRGFGTVLAERDDTVVVEGNHYCPRSSVRAGVLEPSPTTSVCPWKGTASYYTLAIDGETNTDAAWYYPSPKPAANEITDRVAFWKGVTVTP